LDGEGSFDAGDRKIRIDKFHDERLMWGGLKPPRNHNIIEISANFSKTSRWPGLSGLSCCLRSIRLDDCHARREASLRSVLKKRMNKTYGHPFESIFSTMTSRSLRT
jgi:hypothetical protein